MISRGDEKLVRALRRRKIREVERLFLAEGVRVVEELLDSGLDLTLALAAPSLEDTPRGRALAVRLEKRGSLRRVGEGELNALAATDGPQGVLAVARVPEGALESLAPAGRALVAVLDGIQDPGNFGAVVRSADAFGALALAALPGTVDPWNPKSVRAAAGSSFRLPVVQPGPTDLVKWLRRNDFMILGADGAGQPIGELRLPARAALVLGNEGAGIGAEMRAALDGLVAVPIRGGAESLNVGVAAGILLYLLTRSE